MPAKIAALILAAFLWTGCQVPLAGPSSAQSPVPTQPTASFGAVYKIAPDPAGTLRTESADWYKDAVFYHVWVSAFADSDGDRIGDLRGVKAKLDYFQDLGVTALWLSPFFQTSSDIPNLHGYDTTDYFAVDPRFGTLADVKALLAAAHAKGIRVIFDFVPNHTSSSNPWFTDSAANRNGKKSWYLWKPSLPSQGWGDVGGGAAGSGFRWSSTAQQYFYGVFWEGMPDLNYRNPEVKTAMADVVVHWLNLGFDGMRVDAVKYLYENETTGANTDQPETFQFFQDLRAQILDPYTAAGASKFMVAENWTSDTASLGRYLNDGGKPGFHATLDFPFGYGVYDFLAGRKTSGDLEAYYTGFVKPAADAGGWTFTFLNNHDNYQDRPRTAFGSVQKVRVAQALQMAGWGTPILYYGNEIGMTGVIGNDGNFRQPFDWTQVPRAQTDPESNYSWQKTLDRLRLSRASLRRGDLAFAGSGPGTLAVLRTLGTEATLMVVNLTAAAVPAASVDLSGVTLGAGISTLVGPGGDTLAGTVLTVSQLPPYGVRFYALESGTLANLRGDLADPRTPVWIGAKDGSAAKLSLKYYNAAGTVLGTAVPAYTSNGGYWWASVSFPGDQTDGFYSWSREASGTQPAFDSGKVPFHVPSPGQTLTLGFPHYNTGSSETWYLRGILNNWDTGLAMIAVAGEPGHFMVKLTPAQAAAPVVAFKINASPTAWDYFFGFPDVAYDPDRGDSVSSLRWGYTDKVNYNMGFMPDGVSSYEVHFLNQPGTCKIWVKKVNG